jgi:arylformamidase
MIATIQLSNGNNCTVNLAKPIDISMPLMHGAHRAKAWYVHDIVITPVMENGFIGDVNLGGNVNFRNIQFNPHGNGTHTECVGHISKEFYSVNDVLTQTHHLALVITIIPTKLTNGDLVITAIQLQEAFKNFELSNVTALILRTLPNDNYKYTINYSNTNPAYMQSKCAQVLANAGIKHLLIDLPSVDKEVDGGKLAMHHAFWNYPAQPNNNTITEMIYVANQVDDGLYLLNIMIAPFHNDATPSKPVLYALNNL